MILASHALTNFFYTREEKNYFRYWVFFRKIIEQRRILEVASFWLCIGVQVFLRVLTRRTGWRIARCSTILLVVGHIMLTRHYVLSHWWILRMWIRRGALGSSTNCMIDRSILDVWSRNFSWHLRGNFHCFLKGFLIRLF